MKAPILLWALHFCIGCALTLHPHWIYIVPLVLLALLSKRKLQGWVFLIAGAMFTLIRYPSLDIEEVEGQGVFTLQSIAPYQSPFSKSLALKGTFTSFKSGDKFYSHIPCVIFQKKLPKEGTKWLLTGTLQKKGGYVFKPETDSYWKKLDEPLSLARWRFTNKERLRSYFHHKIKDKKVGHFFASMATGDVDDRLLAMEFQKLGLGHILAISGFHFALLAGLIGFLLARVLPPQIAYPSLLFALSLYFIFLGSTPSILRAFVMISLYVLGLILKRKVDVCNLLGVALLVELIIDPLAITNVGCQLSFLATLGILLFYSDFNRLLSPLLPKRDPMEIRKLSFFDQHGYLFSSSIRQALALNLSVYATTLPALLFTFHFFPLISIPYNLVLPPFLSVSLLLLPLGVLFPPLLILNTKYTSWLLQLIATAPETLNYKIFVHTFPFPLLIGIISVVGFVGLTKREQTG